MQSTTPQLPRTLKPRLLGLVVLLGTMIPFYNSLDGAFLLDDYEAIYNNPTIRTAWPPWSALQPPRETSVAARPLTNYTFALNYAVHGLSLRGFHTVNVMIHAAAALALFGLVRRTLLSPTLNDRFAGAADLLAAAIALLWAAHPLQTESVTYLVQRTESLCGLAYLLTLYAFVRSMETSRPSTWQFIAVLTCFAGMACKEVMVTAPLMVLLIDRALFAHSFGQALSSRRGLYLGLAASWLLLGYLLSGSPRPVSAGAALPFESLDYARTEASVVLHYLRLSIWPRPLILDYGWPISSSWSQALPACVAMAALLALAAFLWVRRPSLGLPAVAFFLLLAPTSSFYPILDAAFEHRMYLALAPIVVFVVLGLWTYSRRGLARNPATAKAVLIGFTLVVWHAFTLATIERNAEYADPIAFWKSNLANGRIDNPRAITNLSGAFLMANQNFEAREAALHAVQLSDDNPDAYANLCIASLRLGFFDEAVKMGRIAVELREDSVAAHVNLALAYRAAGRWDAAQEEINKANAICPECVPNLDEALKLAPSDPPPPPGPGL